MHRWAALAIPTTIWRSLETELLAERDRWFLWLPVLIGAGVAGYFALAVEPARWIGGAVLALAALALVALYRRPGARVGLIAAVAVALGFALVQWRGHDVAAPVLARELGPTVVSGRIVEVQAREHGVRLLLDQPSIAGLDEKRTPERIRVTVRTDRGGARAGDWVHLRAVLLPPPEPAAPGAFDFARRAWFESLGAVGYAVSAVTRIEPPAAAKAELWLSVGPWLGRLRNDIAGRVRAPLGTAGGGIAAALMAGDRGTIPPPDLAAMRDAGLAHLLAISGLHIGLLSGSLFFAVRGLLALWPTVALRYPIKKWAAIVTLVGAFGYLLVTGATVPTQRAFLMTGLVLTAVMLDRLAFSMALVAWAAALVLVLRPESLLGPSFQMSFAAVVALIAVYEGMRERLVAWRRRAGMARRVGLYVLGVGLTTLIAGLATAPFAAFHFDRVVGYGLIANLGAVPITALWIMPWALAAYALMPLGLEAVALVPMGWGIEAVLRIAHGVASWPGAVHALPPLPVAGLVAITLGGLWLCLWRRRWRLLGVPVMAGGIVSLAFVSQPDILVSGDAKLLAIRAADGGLVLSSRRARGMLAETWLRRHGPRAEARWPEGGPSDDGQLHCDALGCVLRSKGWTVAISRDSRALAEDCAAADMVISLVPVRIPCLPPVVDRFDLWRDGAHAVWLSEGGRLRVESVRSRRGRRSWTRIRGRDEGQ